MGIMHQQQLESIAHQPTVLLSTFTSLRHRIMSSW